MNCTTLLFTGHHAEIGHTATPTQSQALEMLYNEYLLPVIDRLPASTLVKKSLDSEDVLLHFYEHLDDLTRIFSKYSETQINIKDLDGIREIGMMNLQQFVALATECDFLGPIQIITSTDENTLESIVKKTNFMDDAKDEVTLKDVRQVFSASQHDTAMNDVELQYLQDDSHKETMVFPEYIEAIVRLGFLKYSFGGDSSNSNSSNQQFKCVKMAVMKILASNKKLLTS